MTIPEWHFSRHPLSHSKNAQNAFKETLRSFFDNKVRVFEEWRLSEYWHNLLERCNNGNS